MTYSVDFLGVHRAKERSIGKCFVSTSPFALVNMPFVNLNRTFRDVTDEEQRDSSSIQLREFRQRLGLGGIDWDELLKSRRVVLIAEAGAGKTQELKAQQSRLEDGGKFAFFIPIERVCTESIEAFLQGERALQSFMQWRDASSEKAWFFLDSVDEMKLARHTLEEALRAVLRGLGEAALPRAHFIISSRPLDWRPIDDRNSLDKYLLKYERRSLTLCDDDAFLSPFRDSPTKEQAKEIGRAHV